MHNKPNVSVVVTVFNLSEWIGDALASVLEQTCSPEAMELIVVDDGSTDGSVAIVKSILGAVPTKQMLLKSGHGGPSCARNVGWRQATGEWVQFLDGDDLLHKRKVEIQLAAEACVGPETAALYSDWCRVRLRGRRWVADSDVAAPRVGIEPLADVMRTENFTPIGSSLFRRSWLERVGGFDERHRLIEDVDLLMRIAMRGGGFHRVPFG